MKRLMGLGLLVLATGCGGPKNASTTSEFIVGGNSASDNSQNGRPIRVINNAAVLDATGGAFGDAWGTGDYSFDSSFVHGESSPELDETAQYLYLYQVVSMPDGTGDIGTFSVKLYVPTQDITSWGFFNGRGFADSKGEVSTTNAFGSNMYLNVGVSDLPANPPFVGGVTKPQIVDIAHAADFGPTPATIRIGEGHFDEVWGTDAVLKPGQRSVIVGFTTNDPPGEGPGRIDPPNR